MPIQALEPRRLYRQIADQIAALIRRGEFKPGSRLPPERDLAKQLGVSRPSVREALIALEVEGFVEVRIGSGVYVTSAGSRRAGGRVGKAALPPDSGPFELIEARRLVESECAAQAARHASAAQMRRMKAALATMRTDGRRNVVPLEGDQRFHECVADASGNSALAMLVRTLWAQRTGPLFLRLEHHFDTPALWSAAIAEHQAILAAIESRDPGAARAAMRRHLDMAARRFKVSFNRN
ncbi:FadR family transcriptional regulator [Betaproteobacteria bacterium PRO7]|jgi:DNA-binding FadR family transcriptional regulator|nr:FadR family transcriptional regulator [Betaproteobacteria bacterium PRO7]